jgi:hypothetical protein
METRHTSDVAQLLRNGKQLSRRILIKKKIIPPRLGYR